MTETEANEIKLKYFNIFRRFEFDLFSFFCRFFFVLRWMNFTTESISSRSHSKCNLHAMCSFSCCETSFSNGFRIRLLTFPLISNSLEFDECVLSISHLAFSRLSNFRHFYQSLKQTIHSFSLARRSEISLRWQHKFEQFSQLRDSRFVLLMPFNRFVARGYNEYH